VLSKGLGLTVLGLRAVCAGMLAGLLAAAPIGTAAAQVPVVVDRKMAEHNAKQSAIAVLEADLARRILRLWRHALQKGPAGSPGRDVPAMVENGEATAATTRLLEVLEHRRRLGGAASGVEHSPSPPLESFSMRSLRETEALLEVHRAALRDLSLQTEALAREARRLGHLPRRLATRSRQQAMDVWAGARLQAAEDAVLLREMLRVRSLLRATTEAHATRAKSERVRVIQRGLYGPAP
jgi:hypothetical protein